MQIMQKSIGWVTWRQSLNDFRLFNFSDVLQYCCETSIIQIQQRKVKNIFLVKLSKKSLA